jgi:hypothetical protein
MNKIEILNKYDEAQEIAMHLYARLSTLIGEMDLSPSTDYEDKVLITLRDELLKFCSCSLPYC